MAAPGSCCDRSRGRGRFTHRRGPDDSQCSSYPRSRAWTKTAEPAHRQTLLAARQIQRCRVGDSFPPAGAGTREQLAGYRIRGTCFASAIEERGFNANIGVEGKTYPPNESPLVELRVVSDNYFQTAGIPLLRGRLFTKQEGDDKHPVVVINEAMAQQIWPGKIRSESGCKTRSGRL